jgi:hypothetical protein
MLIGFDLEPPWSIFSGRPCVSVMDFQPPATRKNYQLEDIFSNSVALVPEATATEIFFSPKSIIPRLDKVEVVETAAKVLTLTSTRPCKKKGLLVLLLNIS